MLIAANLASTVLRFVLLREWVFAREGQLSMTTHHHRPHRRVVTSGAEWRS